MAVNGATTGAVEAKRNENMVRQFRSFTSKLIKKKVADSNRIKVGAEGHVRTVVIDGVHEHFFKEIFNWFFLDTLDSVVHHLGAESIAKFSSSRDLCLITPWVSLNVDLDDTELIKGTLLMPLRRPDNEHMECFVPCGGPDESRDDAIVPPSWAVDVPVKSIVPGIDVANVKALHEQPDWFISGKAGDDDVNAVEGGLQVGWEVIIMGKVYEVIGVSSDPFRKYSDQPDWVRFGRPLEKNFRRRKFQYVIPPTVYGTIKTFQVTDLDVHQHIKLNFAAPSEEKIGTLKIEHKNAVFNSSGYLVHDTHI
jgi:hypothetical protein